MVQVSCTMASRVYVINLYPHCSLLYSHGEYVTADLVRCPTPSRAQTKGGVVYKHVMPRPPDQFRYAMPCPLIAHIYIICTYNIMYTHAVSDRAN